MSTQHLALVYHFVPVLEINAPVETIWAIGLLTMTYQHLRLRLVRRLKEVKKMFIRGPALEIDGNSRGVLWSHTK